MLGRNPTDPTGGPAELTGDGNAADLIADLRDLDERDAPNQRQRVPVETVPV